MVGKNIEHWNSSLSMSRPARAVKVPKRFREKDEIVEATHQMHQSQLIPLNTITNATPIHYTSLDTVNNLSMNTQTPIPIAAFRAVGVPNSNSGTTTSKTTPQIKPTAANQAKTVPKNKRKKIKTSNVEVLDLNLKLVPDRHAMDVVSEEKTYEYLVSFVDNCNEHIEGLENIAIDHKHAFITMSALITKHLTNKFLDYMANHGNSLTRPQLDKWFSNFLQLQTNNGQTKAWFEDNSDRALGGHDGYMKVIDNLRMEKGSKECVMYEQSKVNDFLRKVLSPQVKLLHNINAVYCYDDDAVGTRSADAQFIAVTKKIVKKAKKSGYKQHVLSLNHFNFGVFWYIEEEGDSKGDIIEAPFLALKEITNSKNPGTDSNFFFADNWYATEPIFRKLKEELGFAGFGITRKGSRVGLPIDRWSFSASNDSKKDAKWGTNTFENAVKKGLMEDKMKLVEYDKALHPGIRAAISNNISQLSVRNKTKQTVESVGKLTFISALPNCFTEEIANCVGYQFYGQKRRWPNGSSVYRNNLLYYEMPKIQSTFENSQEEDVEYQAGINQFPATTQAIDEFPDSEDLKMRCAIMKEISKFSDILTIGQATDGPADWFGHRQGRLTGSVASATICLPKSLEYIKYSNNQQKNVWYSEYEGLTSEELEDQDTTFYQLEFVDDDKKFELFHKAAKKWFLSNFSGNKYTQMGSKNESKLIERFKKKMFGDLKTIHVFDVGLVKLKDTNSAAVSPDGIAVLHPKESTINTRYCAIEVKTICTNENTASHKFHLKIKSAIFHKSKKSGQRLVRIWAKSPEYYEWISTKWRLQMFHEAALTNMTSTILIVGTVETLYYVIEVQYTPSHLKEYRTFLKEFGKNLFDWMFVPNYRDHRFVERLQKKDPILYAAFVTGWDHSSMFRNYFKKYGILPPGKKIRFGPQMLYSQGKPATDTATQYRGRLNDTIKHKAVPRFFISNLQMIMTAAYNISEIYYTLQKKYDGTLQRIKSQGDKEAFSISQFRRDYHSAYTRPLENFCNDVGHFLHKECIRESLTYKRTFDDLASPISSKLKNVFECGSAKVTKLQKTNAEKRIKQTNQAHRHRLAHLQFFKDVTSSRLRCIYCQNQTSYACSGCGYALCGPNNKNLESCFSLWHASKGMGMQYIVADTESKKNANFTVSELHNGEQSQWQGVTQNLFHSTS